MSRSRRTASAVSALAVMAGGLVSAAVIGVGPARADHCDPAQQTQSPSASPSQSATQRQRNNNNNNQDQQQQGDQTQDPQNQDQQQQQDQGQQTQDQGQQQQQGGGRLLAAPTPSPEAQETQAQDQQAQDQQAQDQQAQDQQQQNNLRRRGNNNNQNQSPSASPSATASPSASASASAGEEDHAEDECADLGPLVTDFIDIRQVGRSQFDQNLQTGRNGSRGTFVSQCGTNANKHNNPDNFIVAPGVSNGAHHLHDYVGNLTTDGFSTDQSLSAGGTTCRFSDKSAYFWPVLRDRKVDVNTTDADGNVGQVLRSRQVQLQFRGNAQAKVVAMPRFLKLITGDAKAATNGGANARAAWSCTGFTNRVTNNKYPLCPRGSQVIRILDFPSCWDGQNTDSANHRTHVVFPGQGGACPQGTKAIPQLRMSLTYQVPQGPSFAVDAFPEQKHNPVTDHADFANVMSDQLMRFVVNCINRGQRC
jgi:hypothetical protein